MEDKIDKARLTTSWTKYDAVKVIEAIGDINFDNIIQDDWGINIPVLRSFLGVDNIEDPYPNYWKEIRNYPKQLRLFALVGALFTHYSIIDKFANDYSQKGKMGGVFEKGDGKVDTNIRSALVVSGAALENYRTATIVPFSFGPLFESGNVGKLMKELFKERLQRIGYAKEELNTDKGLVDAAWKSDFGKALGLTKTQLENWLKGDEISDDEIFRFRSLKIYKEIPMLRINQWMNEWDDVNFKESLRRKPEPYFFLLSIDARLLKKLSDVHRRRPDQERKKDVGVQRIKNDQRVKEISNYIEGGFPWSTISKTEQ